VAADYSFRLSCAIITSEIIPECATWVLLCNSRIGMFTGKLFVSKFVFYGVLFELMVKKFTVISFVTIIGSYRSSDAVTKFARFVLLRKWGHV